MVWTASQKQVMSHRDEVLMVMNVFTFSAYNVRARWRGFLLVQGKTPAEAVNDQLQKP